jgi:hypothetical protein
MAQEPLLTDRRERNPATVPSPLQAQKASDLATSERRTSQRARAAAFCAVAAVIGVWLVFVIRQIADAGFYSDDWAIQWEWHNYGFSEAVSRQFDILGSKPLLGVLLIGSYEVLGTDPALHHLVAALLTLGCTVGFYFVLRGLRFAPRDAIPITLLALLFPWASATRLWPTGALNNFAILLLFAGFLIALRGLRVEGSRGVLVHLAATACYVASILTYEVTTVVALFAWTAYVWLGSWRAALPRMALDLPAIAAAAIYTGENTNKHVRDLSEQLGHIPDVVREGADVIAGSLLPVAIPAEISPAVTVIALAAALGVLVLAALRARASGEHVGKLSGIRWPVVAAAALAALALCWAIYVPQAFYTPTFRGIEDRVNILALYPAAVLVWAVMRSAGSLLRRNGYLLAVAGSIAVAIGYGIQDFRQQDQWLRSTELQPKVLAAVERADAPDGAVVLVFNYPGEIAPRVPVLNVNYDLYPAAKLVTSKEIETYPVFEGSTVRCSPKGVAIDWLATPLYERIWLAEEGTAKLQPYSNVVFVDVGRRRHELIRSREQCARALATYRPGSWRVSS